MSRRTRSKPQPPSPKVAAGVSTSYLDEDGIIRLPRDQYWRWRALDREIRLQLTIQQKAKMQFDAIVAARPELMELRRVMADARRDMNGALRDYEVFKKEVEEATSLNLRLCAIDDVTGRITVVEKDHPDSAPAIPLTPNL